MQALREWLALQKMFHISSLWRAFLTETWVAPTQTPLCKVCVRPQPTSCCSYVTTGVCAPCRCTPDSSPNTSPPLDKTCTEWHSTSTPAHCYSSCSHLMLTTCSWYRCVATRASGSRCSASTLFLVYNIHVYHMAVCDSHVLLVDGRTQYEFTLYTRSTWLQRTLCATPALCLYRMQSSGSRALAATTTRSSHSHATARCLCSGSRHSHCASSISWPASVSPLVVELNLFKKRAKPAEINKR